MVTFKTQFSQSLFNFRCRHKKIPKQLGPVIFNHYYHWPLINSQIPFWVEVLFYAYGIVKTIFSKYLITDIIKKMFSIQLDCQSVWKKVPLGSSVRSYVWAPNKSRWAWMRLTGNLPQRYASS